MGFQFWKGDLNMDVIRKVSVILIFVALVSFVGGFADAEHNAKININTATIEEINVIARYWRKEGGIYS